MQAGFIADKPLGYAQFAAASIDASTLLSSATYGAGGPSNPSSVAGIPAGAAWVMLIPEAQAIRWRDDGIAPTAAIGMPLAVGVSLILSIQAFTQLRVIGQVANAVLNVAFYGQGN